MFIIISNIFHHKLPDLKEYIGLFGYMGIFLFFVTIDQLTFIPEEITLLTIGYFSSQGVFNPVLAGLISVIAFMIVDLVYYFLSKQGRKLTKRLKQRGHGKLKNMEERFKTNFPKTLLILCFIPRMRLFAPIISGGLKIPFIKFIFYDGLALLLFTSVYVSLGVIFHNGLKKVFAKVEIWQNIIFVAFILLAGIFIFFNVRRSLKEKAKN